MKFKFSFLALISILLCTCTGILADEGMFPISELAKLKLSEKGMKLSPQDLFNANQVSLVDGICRVNGCTGSFVSKDGLIITNHHCAFDAIQKASTTSKDLLQNGFIAKNRTEEIVAPGYTVRITQGYQDVSDKVLSIVQPGMNYLQRTEAIEKRRKELEKMAEEENRGLRAEVAEMFAGKTYVLFLYTYLKDVRLVFAPPISIGAFGGETDNWEWPRHTGDFSFMRAYTAPDGSSADYSPNNVPFHPKRFIKVAPQGANEEDFVFLLGYPGRTVRQRTASYFAYEQNVRLPAIVELYGWQISEMERAGSDNRAVAIKHASRIKSLANVEKRSRGQLLGLQRTAILASRREQESALQAFIDADPERKQKYGSLIIDIDQVYLDMSAKGPLEIHLRELRIACRTLAIAFTILDSAVERAKPDLEREAPYMNRNFDLTTQQMKLDIGDLDIGTDTQILLGMLERLRKMPGVADIAPLQRFLSDSRTNAQELMKKSRLGQVAFVESLLKMTPSELSQVDDPMLQWMIQMYPIYRGLRDADKSRDGRLGQLYGALMEVKQLFQPADFVPDANATLRITYGRVRGYSPSDAIRKTPVSTLQGVIEKTTGVEPFITPKEVLDRYRAKEFGPFVHPTLGQVPVAILYNTDTTGGNSGSPVLNAQGDLVAVNFDRTFEATINDFGWSESYSRSIGVDIRYVLWVTGWVYHARHLTDEMGVR